MLDLKSLRYVVVLARRMSYARAADELNISQSTLSRSIQSLEAKLGVRLFDRDRSGVSLTPHGVALVGRAASLLAEVDDIERHTLLNARGAAGRIRFGMAPMPASILLPAVMAQRFQDAPEVTNDVVIQDAEALWRLLIAGEIEFFVSTDVSIPEAPLVVRETLGLVPISLIVRCGHPLLKGGISDTVYPLLRSSVGQAPLPDDIVQRCGGLVNVISDLGVASAVAAASNAIWVSSVFAVSKEIRAGVLCELPRQGHSSLQGTRMVMCSLERRSQSVLTRALKQAFRNHMKTLTQAA